ncbi:MAG: DEAD/DEAH box helicase family protein [Methanocellales archaeon]|nr:DEAD/DEAH box helicase family protein [Methanocellales archaeon]
MAARGIKGLLKNNGKMKLIAGAVFRKEDVDAIREGLESPSKIIERLAIDDFDSIEDEFVKDHVSALGWLIAKDKLEIRVAIVEDQNGAPLDMLSILRRGIFHQKVGIFTDTDGQMVSFSGSINETARAWIENIEEFKVFRSWIDAEHEHFQSDYEKFNRYWHGESKRAKILEIPQAIREHLIQMAPDDINTLNLEWKPRVKKIVELRDYQLQCIKNWIEHGCRGFFEMATGTGKTYAALGCVKELLKKYRRLAVIITCPYAHLIEDPWLKSLEKFDLNGTKAYGSYSQWEDRVADAILDYNNGYSDRVILLTTHDSFYSTQFMNAVQKISGDLLLIADEVHGLGSPERRRGLLENYTFRIGLSATPNRWFDDEGTKVLTNFFGETVFEFTLKEVIKAGYLTEYEYHPHFVSLSSEELEEYRKQTKRIARNYMINKERRSELYDLLCIIRQKIVVNAQEKYRIFEEIINSQSDLSMCLVYCSPEQIDSVQDILNEKGVINHRFTARESIEERMALLKGFSEGAYRVLVAMRCLDEGVDVPATRIAIIMASSGNPRQYIQRRGRILRKFPRKEKAIIHDFLVIPNISEESDPELFQLERKIMRRELRRYEEFAKTSVNYLEALNLMYPYMDKFGVYGGDMRG